MMNDFLPECDFQESHSLFVNSTPEQAFKAFISLDYKSSSVLRFLFFLRGINSGDQFKTLFIPLVRKPPHRYLDGLVARPWKLDGGILHIEPECFSRFKESGYAKIIWGFIFEKKGNGCLITTETRIQCTDASSRRKFGWYWFFIRPFSGLVRKVILRMIRDAV